MGESSTLTTLMHETPSLLAVMIPLIKFFASPAYDRVRKPAYFNESISRLLISSPFSTLTELKI